MSTPAENLTALRNAMRQHGLDAWIAPTADPHLSEYLPEHWQSRSYLTGFTGSAGTLTATADEAVLWTDSRYFEQAAKQLEGSGITLGRTGTDGEPAAWLAERLPENGSAGIAADMLSLDAQQHFQAAFAAKNIRLRGVAPARPSRCCRVGRRRPADPYSSILPNTQAKPSSKKSTACAKPCGGTAQTTT